MQLLNVNGSQFRLSTSEELADAKDALRTAALSGGGFVDLHVDGHRMVSILVTPSSAVTLEEEPEQFVGVYPESLYDMSWIDEL